MLKDTIAAIATANATGAVSLIRISGDEALNIASELIGKDLNKEKGYTIHYGTIRDNEACLPRTKVDAGVEPALTG